MKDRWEQVTSLFAAARELEPAQREAFLAVACAQDQSLRADVDALLAADVPDDSFLQNPPWADAVRLPTMMLQKGQLLKHRYRVDSELAEGGQALVYRATDELLTRPVVIKVMRAEGRRNQRLKSRFEREMKALASIDHPGVVGIIDVGELEDTSPYLVIQYIPGLSLRQALSRGPIPPVRVAEITRQMANALHAAHAVGIAHRDLKPENVMLHSRDDGDDVVRLIDFGIAKIDTSDLSPNTTTVTVAGTVRYMAPEQFEGKHSVASDIYSMALIVCEMLGGRPDIRTLPRSTTAKARRALEVALAHQPEERPTDVQSWSKELALSLRSPKRTRKYAPVVTGLGVLMLAAFLVRQSSRVEALPVIEDIRPFTFEPGIEIEPSLSPDGRYVAYAGGTPSRLYLRQQGSRPVPLVTPDTGPPEHRPRWSPDGTRIVFDAGRKIFVIPALGGQPRQVVGAGWSPTWSPDGQRIAYALDDSIFTIDVRGGRPTPLAVVMEPSELTWSPDGRWIALTAGNDVWDGLIHIANIAPSRILLIGTGDGRVVDVTDRSSMNVAPTWTPDSRQLFFISNRAGARDIYRVRLGADGRAIGQPNRLTTGLDAHTMALSARGDHVVYAMYRGRVNIWSLPVQGAAPASVSEAVALTTGNQLIESISVSPDRRWIYFTSDRAGNSDIWRVARSGGEPTQVTNDPADEFAAEQSPDGQWLAYYSLQSGTRDIWIRPTDSGEPVRLTTDAEEEHQPHWSPDGKSLCYSQESSRASKYSIRMIRRDEKGWGAPTTLLDANGMPNTLLGCSGWLPDGRHLVVQDGDRSLIALMPDGGGALRVLYRWDPGSGVAQPIWVRVEPRTGTIFFRDWQSIWLIDPAKPVPRQIARFDDVIRRSTRIEMDADSERVYFTLGDPQSELNMARVSGLAKIRD
jgi:serine/threonine-protein kinase